MSSTFQGPPSCKSIAELIHPLLQSLEEATSLQKASSMITATWKPSPRVGSPNTCFQSKLCTTDLLVNLPQVSVLSRDSVSFLVCVCKFFCFNGFSFTVSEMTSLSSLGTPTSGPVNRIGLSSIPLFIGNVGYSSRSD